MNVFLTPVMHHDTASDFKVIEKGLQRTLQSLSAQTDQGFIWVIVCNGKLNIGDVPENVHFHYVEFPPADAADMSSKMADKGAKLVSGLLYVHQYNPRYVYFLDADDYDVILFGRKMEQLFFAEQQDIFCASSLENFFPSHTSISKNVCP